MSLPSYAMNQPSFPEMYEEALVGPLFRPWAEITFDELHLAPGDRVLDIACGTGIVARVAKERLGDTGQIVGVDLSPDMLVVARRVGPGIDWLEGDATALPLNDEERFDVVVCQQGLQFFKDKTAAVAQMSRALRTGGRLAVSTWLSDEEIPFMRDLRRVAERHVGPIADPRHSFGNGAQLEALLRDGGFTGVRSQVISRTIRFNDRRFVRMNAMALVGMSEAGKAMDKDERKRAAEAIGSDSESVLQAYADGPGVAFELSTNLATARG